MRNKLAIGTLLVLGAACGSAKPATSGPAPQSQPAAASATAVRSPLPAAQPAPVQIPRAALFGSANRANVQVSPDGKYLSWLAPAQGVMNVFVAPVSNVEKAAQLTQEQTRPLRMYQWALDGKSIVYIQDSGGDENYHLWRVVVKGGQAKGRAVDLTPWPKTQVSILRTSPRRPGHVLVTANDRKPEALDVHLIDLATGKAQRVLTNDQGFMAYVADEQLEVRAAQRMRPDGGVDFLQRTAKGWAPLASVGSDDAMTTSLASVSRTERRWIDSRDRNTAAVFSEDLKGRRTLVAEDTRADATDMLTSRDESKLLAVEFEYDRSRWQVVDKSVAADVDGLNQLAGENRWGVVSRTADDAQWVVVVVGPTSPVAYYLWPRKTRKASLLFVARPELANLPLVPMHPVEIPARDGLSLMSYLSLPAQAAGADAKPKAPLPLVLFVHGGPWARDHHSLHPVHQLLANRGYAVLSVNFRGSTGFGKAFINAANLQWGKAMHDDLLDAVDYAVKQGITTRDAVCIMGGSYGGYATLAGLAMTPDVFRCGVDIVGPSNLVTLIENLPPQWAAMAQIMFSRVGDPRTDAGKQGLLAVSPLTHAAQIKRPLLILQGANDPRVKQQESEQIVSAMQAAKIPVTYVLYPDEGHGFARAPNNISSMAALELFAAQHLGGSYEPLSEAERAATSMQIKVGGEGVRGLLPPSK